MRGFVPTPDWLVDAMVEKLFRDKPPHADARVLDPGCGEGPFINGVIRYCERNAIEIPQIVGIELHPIRAAVARERFGKIPAIDILAMDFLDASLPPFDYIIGNPPYVPITSMHNEEKIRLRRDFTTATGRFDLYMLFFEKSIQLLNETGKLVFVTPEKYTYVASAKNLRNVLAPMIDELEQLPESAFTGVVAYPLITTLSRHHRGAAYVRLRDDDAHTVQLDRNGSSWLPSMMGGARSFRDHTLKDVCTRISCGIATGADSVFIHRNETISEDMKGFAFHTIAGREIDLDRRAMRSEWSMLVPYDRHGRLLPFKELGAFGDYLRRPENEGRLRSRTCARRKPWYAFHETPDLSEILKTKIICKDISKEPCFFLDEKGALLPRHSVYYIVPARPAIAAELLSYLNSNEAREWLTNNCQRAANGFIRLQSDVLKRLPIPDEIVEHNGRGEGRMSSTCKEGRRIEGAVF